MQTQTNPEEKTKTQNPCASGLKPIRRCKTCDGFLLRSVNHMCPLPTTCIESGASEWNHECRGEAD